MAQRVRFAGQIALGASGFRRRPQHAYDTIAERRRAGFSARALTRTASPLSPDFWTSLASAAESDGDRLQTLASDARPRHCRRPSRAA